MAKTVRVGFIGAGGIAQVHGDAVEAAGGKVLGVVDTDLTAAQRVRKMLTVGYVRRFLPESELIKSKIDQGCLGKIYWVEARWMRRRGVPGYGGWFTTKKLSGGGPLIDLGCHMLDLICWLLGQHRVARVSASVGCHLAKHNYVYTKM